MGDSKRGPILTFFALLLVVAAIQDSLKGFHLEGPDTGLVFFGMRLSGFVNAAMGPVVGLVLLFYAASIWRMRRVALYLAWAYAAYVTFNLVVFTLTHSLPPSTGERVFGTVYSILALIMTWGVAILLRQRRADLA